ncbi:MAG TPA: phosphatidate cytidylyltransferase [Flavobacterium sp.]|jgi:phosphatidate cytidylyltransferase
MNETVKRSISGIVYIILLIGSILYSTESFFLLFGLFLLIAVYEYCTLVNLNTIFALFLAVAIFSGFAYLILFKIKFDVFKFDLLLCALTILVSIRCIYFLFSLNNNISLLSKYIYLLGYIILPFIILTKIPFGIKGYNPKIILSIFILIWTNDTFAYIVGKSIGKHKLFERISPKKTVEGFIGGLILCIIASYFISKYFIEGGKSTQNIWFVIAAIIAIFGTIGDLIESKFKRIAGVKDSGKIMPGHGGILDRLDSVIFVAPFVFLFYQILNYVTLS